MDGTPPRIENPAATPADLRTLMCVMDLADQSRARLREQEDEENPDKIVLNKESLASQLRDQYKKQGIEMPAEAIREAVDEFVDSQSRYQRSLAGLPLFLALTYIRRGRIFAAVAGVAVLTFIGLALHSQHDRSIRVASADSVRAQANTLLHQWQDTDQSAAGAKAGEEDFARTANRLIAGNPSVAPFQTILSQWLDEGQKDHASVRRQLDQLRQQIEKISLQTHSQSDPPLKLSAQQAVSLTSATSQLNAAARVVAASRSRLDAENLALKAWSSYVEENFDLSRPNALNPIEREGFSSTLQEAEADLRADQFADAETKLEQNQRLFSGAGERGRHEAEAKASITLASDRIKILLQRVRAEAADDRARAEVERRIHEGELDVATADLDLLKSKERSLQILDAALNVGFHLRIPANPPGGRTGVQRTSKTTGGKQWYIVVEAVDDNNIRVKYPVRNVETGRMENVSVWAEAVPNEVMAAIRQEKSNRGYISHPDFGLKRRGALAIEYTKITEPIGEITSW